MYLYNGHVCAKAEMGRTLLGRGRRYVYSVYRYEDFTVEGIYERMTGTSGRAFTSFLWRFFFCERWNVICGRMGVNGFFDSWLAV